MFFRSVEEARAARDLAIECMARLNNTGIAVKAHGSEAYWIKYRRLLGRVMGAASSAINAAVEDVRSLDPSEEERREIARARIPDDEADAMVRARDADALAPHLATIKTRLAQLGEMLGPEGHPWVARDWRWPEFERVAMESWTTAVQ